MIRQKLTMSPIHQTVIIRIRQSINYLKQSFVKNFIVSMEIQYTIPNFSHHRDRIYDH